MLLTLVCLFSCFSRRALGAPHWSFRVRAGVFFFVCFFFCISAFCQQCFDGQLHATHAQGSSHDLYVSFVHAWSISTDTRMWVYVCVCVCECMPFRLHAEYVPGIENQKTCLRITTRRKQSCFYYYFHLSMQTIAGNRLYVSVCVAYEFQINQAHDHWRHLLVAMSHSKEKGAWIVHTSWRSKTKLTWSHRRKSLSRRLCFHHGLSRAVEVVWL